MIFIGIFCSKLQNYFSRLLACVRGVFFYVLCHLLFIMRYSHPKDELSIILLTHSKTKDRDQPRNTKLHTTVGLGCLYNNFFNFQEFFSFRSSNSRG